MKRSGGMVLQCLKILLLHLFSGSEKKHEGYLVRTSLGREYFLVVSDIVVTTWSKISMKNKEFKYKSLYM